MKLAILLPLVGILFWSAPAYAQHTIPACQSQQELEQVLASDGNIMPQGCRSVTISSLESEGQRLCLLDLSTVGDGVLEQLRDAAVNQQWWVRCEDLSAVR